MCAQAPTNHLCQLAWVKQTSKLVVPASFPSVPKGRTIGLSLVPKQILDFFPQYKENLRGEETLSSSLFISSLVLDYCEWGLTSFWKSVFGREIEEGRHRDFIWGAKGKCLLFHHGASGCEKACTFGKCQTEFLYNHNVYHKPQLPMSV